MISLVADARSQTSILLIQHCFVQAAYQCIPTDETGAAMIVQPVHAIARKALQYMEERPRRAREGKEVEQVDEVEHHPAEWREGRQRST